MVHSLDRWWEKEEAKVNRPKLISRQPIRDDMPNIEDLVRRGLDLNHREVEDGGFFEKYQRLSKVQKSMPHVSAMRAKVRIVALTCPCSMRCHRL